MCAEMSFQKKIVLCLSIGLGMTGCFGGGESLPELTEVTGSISLDGSPLPGASVVFLPEEGGSAFAMTDEDGKFELMYNRDTSGAVPGSYKVTVSKEKDPKEPGMELIPEKYNEKSTLTAEVKPDVENDFQFDLTSK